MSVRQMARAWPKRMGSPLSGAAVDDAPVSSPAPPPRDGADGWPQPPPATAAKRVTGAGGHSLWSIWQRRQRAAQAEAEAEAGGGRRQQGGSSGSASSLWWW